MPESLRPTKTGLSNLPFCGQRQLERVQQRLNIISVTAVTHDANAPDFPGEVALLLNHNAAEIGLYRVSYFFFQRPLVSW